MAALAVAACAWQGAGQTTVDLTGQGRLRTGTVLPSQCSTGQMFLLTGGGTSQLHTCAGNVWTAVATGGGSAGGGLCSMALTATPVFDGGQCSTFSLALGETAVTSSTLVNARAGQTLTFIISQDQTGGRAFSWPANVKHACVASGSPAASTIMTAVFDGANAEATSCTTSEAATLITGPTRVAPATPSTGLSCWFDASGTWKCKDTSGNVRASVLTASGPTGQQFVTYIDGDGVAHTAAVSAAQLAEGTTGSGAVVRAGSPTITTPTIASFANAAHGHADAAGGGQIAEGGLNLSDVTTGDATNLRHGWLPKLPGDNSKCLLGDGTYGACGSGGTDGSGGLDLSTAGVYRLDTGFYLAAPPENFTIDSSLTAGKMGCYQFDLPVRLTLGKLTTKILGLGSNIFQLAIYTDAADAPGTKVSGSDLMITSPPSEYILGMSWGTSHPVLSPGVYWACYSAQTQITLYRPWGHTFYGYALAKPRQVKCTDTVTYNGAMPNTCTSPTGNDPTSMLFLMVHAQ
jgi:hypothetical protein